MAHFRIALLPGDGIGAEVIGEAVRVLAAVGGRFDHSFEYSEDTVGGAAIEAHGVALREETLEMCRAQDAVLFGAVGGPKWDDPAATVRPEQAILGLRKGLGLFANIRPVKMLPFLADSTPLKRETVEQIDMVVLRELTGGIYFGQPQRRWQEDGQRHAVDTLAYSEEEGRADRPPRLRDRPRPPRPAHLRRQGQHPRHLPHVARNRRKNSRPTTPMSRSSIASSTPAPWT